MEVSFPALALCNPRYCERVRTVDYAHTVFEFDSKMEPNFRREDQSNESVYFII